MSEDDKQDVEPNPVLDAISAEVGKGVRIHVDRILRAELQALTASMAGQLKGIAKHINKVNEHLLATDQRELTNELLKEATWAIWGYCRNHQNALDSERHCAVILEMLEGAVTGVQTRCESLSRELRRTAGERNEARREIKDLKKRVEELIEEAKKADTEAKAELAKAKKAAPSPKPKPKSRKKSSPVKKAAATVKGNGKGK